MCTTNSGGSVPQHTDLVVITITTFSLVQAGRQSFSTVVVEQTTD